MNKILILSKNSLEMGRGGEIFFIELAVGLSKYYDLTLLDTTTIIGKKYLTIKEIKRRLTDVDRLPSLRFANFRFLNKYFNFPYPRAIVKLYKNIKRNDIIYTTSGNLKINLILILYSLLNPRVKFIIGYHKPIHGEKKISLYNLKYRMIILFFSLFKKKFYHHTISLHTKRYLENFLEPDNVRFLIEGLELKNFKQEDDEKNKEDMLRFLYVGFLDNAHKGVGVLLKAIEQFLTNNEDLKVFFEIIGIGPLESEVKKLEQNFPNHIHSLGYLLPEELAEYYKRSDVYLFSSRKEPFGRVIIEALAGKSIIICTRTVGSIEILKGKEFAFFLPKLDVKQFEDKIKEVYNLWLENPERVTKLKDLAKEYVFSKYTIGKEIEAFTEFINKIL